jgi:hypothetical protein
MMGMIYKCKPINVIESDKKNFGKTTSVISEFKELKDVEEKIC